MRVLWALVGVFALIGGASCTRNPVPRPVRTLRIPMLKPVATLDPALTRTSGWDLQVGQAYEGLFQYDYRRRPYVLEPALAEAIPQPSLDGRTYLIAIRPGVLFHDDPSFAATGGRGRELMASDFVFSLKRIADPALESPNWRTFKGLIEGLDEWRSAAEVSKAAAYEEKIGGLEAIDRYTLRIVLKHRFPQLLHVLSLPAAYVVPSEAVKHYGREFGWNPVGTGPFRLVREESSPDRKIVWVRNPTYAAAEVPLSDRVEYELFPDFRAMWDGLLAGKLDLAPVDHEVADLDASLGDRGLRLEKAPVPSVSYVALNMADPILSGNKVLRQAFAAAYDPEFEIQRLHDGRAVQAEGPIPPGVPGHDPEIRDPERQSGLKAARKLLEKAGFPAGKGLPTLHFAVAVGDSRRALAEHFANQLRSLGVRIDVQQHGRQELRRVIADGAASFWLGTWSAEFPDAEEVLRLFYRKGNRSYDRLFEKAAATLDAGERVRLHRKLAAGAVSLRAWILGVHPVIYVATRERLTNFVIHAFDPGRAKYYAVPPTGSL